MPCSDGGFYRDMKEQELKQKAENLEALLCGLNNFLVAAGIQREAIDYVKKESGADFQSWVIEHNKKDVERVKEKLKRSLSGFSNDEMKIVNELLKSGKIEK